jgi:hypothetical protein
LNWDFRLFIPLHSKNMTLRRAKTINRYYRINRLAMVDCSAEKAGGGGSIRSLATIF